jgi:hypothetical protein
LISLLSDSNERFFRDIQNENILREKTLFPNSEIDNLKISELNTNLTTDNFYKERQFKLKVLDWLTNGEPKLFRSPAEGNYIVRLMNSSLAPNDTLGRMLHTFSCTAYEVADYTYENLNKYDFIHLKDPEVATLRFETKYFSDIDVSGKGPDDFVQVNTHPITTVRVIDMMPGDTIQIWPTDYEKDMIEVKIGVTGSYYVDLGVEIKKLMIPVRSIYPNAGITYSFYSIAQNQFDKINDVTVSEVPTH